MKKKTTAGELNGFLDAGSHIRGELLFEDTFRIDGRVTGTIVSRGDLVVGEAGEVDGDVQVKRVFISGSVRGSIQAKERIEINSTARVVADLDTPTLVVEEGAFLEGRCTMRGAGKAADGDSAKQGSISQMPLSREV